MTSKFNIHIFPRGNIGEVGYAGDLHLSKAHAKGEDASKVSFEPAKVFMFRHDRELKSLLN